MTLRKHLFCALTFFAVALTSAGCGTGWGSGGSSIAAASIMSEPANVSVPMGLTAGFNVVAHGSGLTYQWLRGGVPIAGATASTYTTPATTLADSGALFTVTVSNSTGSVTSTPAQLTVTARAPLAGDLRFQQVDAATTLTGFDFASSSFGTYIEIPPPGGQAYSLSGSNLAGTPFRLTNTPGQWLFYWYSTPSSGVNSAYTAAYTSQLTSALGQSIANLPPPSDPRSVIIAMGLPSTYPTVVAFGYMNAGSGPAYFMQQATVSAAAFPAAVAQEGAHGRVVTAMYEDAGNVTYFSYGWAGDPTGIYEAEAVSTALGGTADAIAAMAQQGYIVTATTSTQAVDGSGVLLVGTRVQGDTMPRPVMAVSEPDVPKLQAAGYAIVAMVITYDSNYNILLNQYIGER